jgi:hypothetical protein
MSSRLDALIFIYRCLNIWFIIDTLPIFTLKLLLFRLFYSVLVALLAYQAVIVEKRSCLILATV